MLLGKCGSRLCEPTPGGVHIVKHKIVGLARWVLGAAAVSLALAGGAPLEAQTKPRQVGKIEWGAWIDDDGCMHWWADGGLEGYMVPRRNPQTGKPVCLKKNTCLVENTDTLFATDSAHLTAHGRARLTQFFH